jgi:hypothetical protein
MIELRLIVKAVIAILDLSKLREINKTTLQNVNGLEILTNERHLHRLGGNPNAAMPATGNPSSALAPSLVHQSPTAGDPPTALDSPQRSGSK